MQNDIFPWMRSDFTHTWREQESLHVNMNVQSRAKQLLEGCCTFVPKTASRGCFIGGEGSWLGADGETSTCVGAYLDTLGLLINHGRDRCVDVCSPFNLGHELTLLSVCPR